MTDEEKKAIEEIKSFNQYNWEMNNLKEREFAKPYFDALDTVLNLIEKQSKEVEENKKYLVNLTHEQYIKLVEQIRSEINKEWKDVIKAKIEELDYKDISNFERRCKQEILQSLLEKE